MIGIAQKMVLLLSCNAYDLTQLLQSKKDTSALAILEDSSEWIEIFWRYARALANFLAVGGFVLLSRMIA